MEKLISLLVVVMVEAAVASAAAALEAGLHSNAFLLSPRRSRERVC